VKQLDKPGKQVPRLSISTMMIEANQHFSQSLNGLSVFNFLVKQLDKPGKQVPRLSISTMMIEANQHFSQSLNGLSVFNFLLTLLMMGLSSKNTVGVCMIFSFFRLNIVFFIITICGCSDSDESKLVAEILSLDKPIFNEVKNINHIIDKYITVGMTRIKAIEILESAEFNVSNNGNSDISKYRNSIDKLIAIKQISGSDPQPFSIYRVVVQVDLTNDVITQVQGTYIRLRF
jgi:hypothetical protein